MNRLKNRLPEIGSDIYYDPKFRSVLEDHIPYLIIDNKYTERTVKDNLVFKYENDFYGLLSELRVPVDLHWMTLRMNGFINPNQYKLSTSVIILPDISDALKISKLYMTYSQLS